MMFSKNIFPHVGFIYLILYDAFHTYLFHLAINISKGNKEPCVPGCEWSALERLFKNFIYMKLKKFDWPTTGKILLNSNSEAPVNTLGSYSNPFRVCRLDSAIPIFNRKRLISTKYVLFGGSYKMLL